MYLRLLKCLGIVITTIMSTNTIMRWLPLAVAARGVAFKYSATSTFLT